MLPRAHSNLKSFAPLGCVLALACNSKEATPGEQASPPAAAQFDAQPTAAAVEESPAADAALPPRNWLCSVVDKVPRGGRFGEAKIKKRHPKHAGIKKVLLHTSDMGVLHLAVLAEDDTENDRGLSTNEPSPARSLDAYRLANDEWENLGRPFQLIGWDVSLDGAVSGGPPAYAVSTGIGDVRRALVASCESGNWTKRARFLGKSFEAAALVAMENPDAIENAAIVRGLYADLGKDCKPVRRFGGGGKIPVWLEAPPSLVNDASKATIPFAAPGECRLPRKFMADQKRDELAVSYEQCQYINGGDYLQITNCQLSTLWFTKGAWKRLPAFPNLAGDLSEPRAALALGATPTVAVYERGGIAIYAASDAGWTPLPPLSGAKGCQIPIALRADPARIVLRSCGGYGQATAWRLENGAWKKVAGKMNLKPAWGAQQRPSVAADWIDETPYLAIGYHGAPVARVFEGASGTWKLSLETVVNPKRAKAGP